MEALAPSEVFLFDDFRLDRRGGGLFRRDHNGAFAPVAVGGRGLDILCVLVANAGAIVSKEEIIAAVWPSTVVEDSSLTVQISALRRVLDRDRTNGSCIQTVPGRGYRFVSAVTQLADDTSATDGDDEHAQIDSPEPAASLADDRGTGWRRLRHVFGAVASTRRLAAILALDVVGYSRLMGADEEGTDERLKAHHRQLVEPKIRQHQGRIVKTTGNGMLVEFHSAVDAVRCAAEIQRDMIDRETELPGERRIELRIGINLGDVIAERGDIFGDGVNVAARLEALAEPGGICVSGVVRDQLRDQQPFEFDDLGEQSVKNIARPVRVYALRPEAIAELPSASLLTRKARSLRSHRLATAAAGAVLLLVFAMWALWPRTRPSATPVVATATSILQPFAAPRLSMVVLPFANLSKEPDQQYFADGITEDLTTDLSRTQHSFVISRNTAFTYRNKPIDTRQIGRELGVRYVVEGSVRRSGSTVRVNVQLIDAENDVHLWADQFDGDMSDLLALQNDIAGRIAIALGFELIGREAARPNENPDALDYFFRASAALSKPPSSENYAEAISLQERALALDPQSAEAQSRLASTLAGRVMNVMSDSATDDLERAKALSKQALASWPRSPIAHYAMGQALRAERRYAEAIPEYEAVLALNPNYALSFFNIGQCKLVTGSIDETIPLTERAIRLSPRDPFALGTWYSLIGVVHLLQSRTNEAIIWLEKARSHSPAHAIIRANLASAYAINGEIERAAIELTRGPKA
jgi:TolB-like protein/class 3 adenylate cyclase/Flp pilus assembly protein TadD